MLAENREQQIEQKLTVIRQLIQEHAQAKRDRVYLEQFRKVKKAMLMRVAERGGHTSIGAQEREAYSHTEYEQVVEGLADATRKESETWWMLRLEEWKFEAWRSRMATERAERQRYGG